MAEAKPRVRMNAVARRALLLEVAESVFVEQGFTQSGLAEIADRAGVSKTLLYHYFPDGRPELYREVMSRLVNELVNRLRLAGSAPVSAESRVTAVAEQFLQYFSDEPAAFRLLMLEPWGSGDSSIEAQAMAVRVLIGYELNVLLAASGRPVSHTMAASAATVGSLLHVAELWMSGQIERDDAVEVVGDYVRGGLISLGML